jgi:heme-degrading monooxygenase HmoA
VIVRVLTARVLPRHAARFNDLLRGQLAELREQPGLVYVKLARRFDEGGDQEVVLFEEWRTPSDLWRWTRGRLSEPRLLPGTDELIDNLIITHYEALDLDPEELERAVLSRGALNEAPADWATQAAGVPPATAASEASQGAGELDRPGEPDA